MSATVRRLIVLVVVLGLFGWVFGDAIFHDRNFVYRDAGHFYYPLLKLVQDEWEAGRWPLWNPYENAGMPLLGNPASAVLYPPRVVLFQWLPISYAAAYQWYILLHVLWSAVTAYGMARNWRASGFAAGVAALSYAFGASVLFQYANVIFLVGASWVPLGLTAADRALRAGDTRWAVVLGVVLALQMLGGDPEAAYVTGGLAAFYVAVLDPPWAIGLGAALGLAAAAKGREEAAHILGLTVLAAPWLVRIARSDAASAPTLLQTRRKRTLALVLAAGVAGGLSAVQWIPSWEFGRLSARAAPESSHEPYAFWVAPWRFAEMLWPNVSGHQFPENTRWLDIFRVNDGLWEPSLYFGVVPLLLALAAWGVRRVAPWQRWLSIVLVLSLWAATGPGGGVSWYVNQIRAARAGSSEDAAGERAGERADRPPDTPESRPPLQYPAGGLYWFLVQVLPGFGGFRYPAKLMTFAAAALATLAAVGWDRLIEQPADGPVLRTIRRTVRLFAAPAAASAALCLVAILLRPWLTARFAESHIAEGFAYYGPLLVSGAFRSVVLALVQSAIVLGLLAAVVYWLMDGRAGRFAPVVILLLIAVDLALANRWMIVTAPQPEIDAVPKLVEILREADAADGGSSGPEGFRIHRTSVWWPMRWAEHSSPERDEEIFRWEKDTIQPKYGVPHGVRYTINEGTLEPYDYWFFFGPFRRTLRPELKRELEKQMPRVPDKVVYHPRRGHDMWGAKYFVLPKLLVLDEQDHGYLTFLPHTEPVASSSPQEDDFQVLRNLNCYPRAWIVHRVLVRDPIRGLRRADRLPIMEAILYQGDELWFDAALERTKQDPRQVAWIEVPPRERELVESYQSSLPSEADHCEVVRYEPQRVELLARTSARGVLVVAEIFFPGWHVTVDDQPQQILRANRMMRGVLLEPGEHRVVFEYRPLSFRVGGTVSLLTLAGLVLYGVAACGLWLMRGHGR